MKHLSFFILFLISFTAIGQNTITTSTLTQTSFCAGGNIIVQYTTTGTFPIGCTFNAELSDASGSFANPIIIGSMPLNTGVIAGTIPMSTTFGFGYRVRVSATNPVTVGSTSTTTLIITSTAATATIIANPASGTCHGDSVSLWVTFNASYYWSTGQTTQTIYVAQSGTYTCTVTNYLTGCEVTSNPQVVKIHPTPHVNLGSDRDFCNGQHIILDAGSGFSTYLWNDSSASEYLNIHHTGTYSVSVKDSFGCKGGDTVHILFHPNPVVDLGHDTSLCGNSFLISAGMGYSAYNWNNGLSFNPKYLAQSSGTYFVSVTDSNGCSDRDTVHVSIHPIPVINLGNDLTVYGSSVVLNAGPGYAEYDWNNGLDTTQYFPVTSSGTYFVKITDQHGCSNYDTLNVTIYKPAASETFSLYPNPFHDVLNIVSNQNLSEAKPVLYDMLGRKYYPAFSLNSSGMLINRSNLSGGCYVLLLDNKEGLHYVGKLILE